MTPSWAGRPTRCTSPPARRWCASSCCSGRGTGSRPGWCRNPSASCGPSRYLREAEILAEPMGEGRVRAVVRVRDSWSLLAYTSFSTLGGQSRSSATVLERNLLGTGNTLGYTFSKDPVRTNRILQWSDPQVLGSNWATSGSYNQQSDGRTRTLNAGLPFYALDTPWSAGVQLLDNDQGNGISDRTGTVGTVWARAPDGERLERVVPAPVRGPGHPPVAVGQRRPAAGREHHRRSHLRAAPSAPTGDKRVRAWAWGGAWPRTGSCSAGTSPRWAGWRTCPRAGAPMTLAWNTSLLGSSRTSPGLQLQAGCGWDLGPDAYASWGRQLPGPAGAGQGRAGARASTSSPATTAWPGGTCWRGSCPGPPCATRTCPEPSTWAAPTVPGATATTCWPATSAAGGAGGPAVHPRHLLRSAAAGFRGRRRRRHGAPPHRGALDPRRTRHLGGGLRLGDLKSSFGNDVRSDHRLSPAALPARIITATW